MTMTLAASYPPPPPLPWTGVPAPRRLGLWRGLGWLGLATLAGFAVPILYGVTAGIWNLARPAHPMPLPKGLDAAGASIFMVTLAVFFATIILACRSSGWRAVDYLALTRPRGAFLRLGALAFVVPLAVAIAAAAYGGPGTATTPGAGAALLLLVIAVTVLAPVCEEILFRGFLFRVLADSRIGVTGAIVLTALVWASLHTDKSWLGMSATFFTGLVWGWLRWRTQSTLATIAVHALNNLVAAAGITATALAAGS